MKISMGHFFTNNNKLKNNKIKNRFQSVKKKIDFKDEKQTNAKLHNKFHVYIWFCATFV